MVASILLYFFTVSSYSNTSDSKKLNILFAHENTCAVVFSVKKCLV